MLTRGRRLLGRRSCPHKQTPGEPRWAATQAVASGISAPPRRAGPAPLQWPLPTSRPAPRDPLVLPPLPDGHGGSGASTSSNGWQQRYPPAPQPNHHRQSGTQHQQHSQEQHSRQPLLARAPQHQQQQDAPASAPSESGRVARGGPELMGQIKGARSWQQLQAIVQQNGVAMNHMHVSAVVTHMAQLHASSSGPGAGSSSSRSGRAGFGSGAGDDLLAAVEARHAPRRQQQRQHQQRPSAHQQHQHQQPSDSGELDAFLQLLERAVMYHLPSFEGRQLANTLWGFAKLGHRPPAPWLEAVLSMCHRRFSTFQPQHLANTLYALMQLEYVPGSVWLSDFFAAVRTNLYGFKPGELAQLSYAGGKLRLQPGRSLIGGIMAHSAKHFDSYGIRELALLLYGITNMAGRAERREWMRRYRLRVLAVLLESGAVPEGPLEVLRPYMNQCLGELLVRQSVALHASGNGTTAGTDALRRQGVRIGVAGPAEVADDGGGGPAGGSAGAIGSSIGGGSGRRLSDQQRGTMLTYVCSIVHSLGNLGYQPPPAFLNALLAAVGEGAHLLDPVSTTSLLLGLAYMGYRPKPAWFRKVWARVMECLPALSTQQCANCLWAAGRMGLRPGGCLPPRDVRAVLLQAASRLPEHTNEELVALLQAAAALGLSAAAPPVTPRALSSSTVAATPASASSQALEHAGGHGGSGGGGSAGSPVGTFACMAEWTDLVASQLYSRLPYMHPAEAVVVLGAFADLSYKPHRVWMERWTEAVRPSMGLLPLSQLSAAAHASARLGFRPPPVLRTALLRAAGKRISEALAAADAEEDPQQQEEAAAAAQAGKEGSRAPATQAGKEGSRAPATAAAVVAVGQGRGRTLAGPLHVRAQRRLAVGGRAAAAGLAPQVMGRLLWSLAMLDVRPGEGWMAVYMEGLARRLGEYGPRELSLVVWALTRMRYDPGPEWMEAFVRLSGEGAGRQGASSLAEQEEGVVEVSARTASGAVQAAAGQGHGRQEQLNGAEHRREQQRQGEEAQGQGLEMPSDGFSAIILQGLASWAVRLLREAQRGPAGSSTMASSRGSVGDRTGGALQAAWQ